MTARSVVEHALIDYYGGDCELPSYAAKEMANSVIDNLLAEHSEQLAREQRETVDGMGHWDASSYRPGMQRATRMITRKGQS